MSRFISKRFHTRVPYIPGEQPRDKQYIKLNANETSMKPSPKVLEVVKSNRMEKLGFYTDPSALEFRKAIAEKYNLKLEEIIAGNGADEMLSLLFLTFFDGESKIAFPDITYDFYSGFAKTFGLDAQAIPLTEDYKVDVEAFIQSGRHIILANPNAPTGYALSLSEIERMVASDENRLVIIDEAYVDYGNESCIPLIRTYSNLIVVHTLSKSRNLAGAHIGYAVGDPSLIEDVNDIRAVVNPFNLNDMAIAIGTAAIRDEVYFEECMREVIGNREYLKEELSKLGFTVMDSKTNFIFVTHPYMNALTYSLKLKEYGILTRHYKLPRINNYLRITIGTREEMNCVVEATKHIVMSVAV